MLQRDFILGEEKCIKFKATSCDNVPVVVTDATYTLTKGEEVVSSGVCSVNGAEFAALIQPTETGEHLLTVTYIIAPETRKVRVAIHVA